VFDSVETRHKGEWNSLPKRVTTYTFIEQAVAYLSKDWYYANGA